MFAENAFMEMLNLKNKIPELMIEIATMPSMYEIDDEESICLNHVIISCSADQKKEIKESFKTIYTSLRIDEMKKLVDEYECVCLYEHERYCDMKGAFSQEFNDDYDIESDFEDTELLEIDGYLWSFNPRKIKEFGITFSDTESGIIIKQQEVPVYSDCEGDNILDSSSIMEESLQTLCDKFPEISYYAYEGYFIIDTHGSDCFEREYFSSEKEIPEVDHVIGKYLKKFNWKGIADYISKNLDVIEETKELIEFLEKYKNYIGKKNTSILMKVLEEYCSDKDDE